LNFQYLIRKLRDPHKFERIAKERLTEPIHLNLLSLFVALFGTYRMKVEFDVIVRQQFAFSLLKAADEAARSGLRSVTVIEFGVAAGAGLLNICEISREITKETGVDFRIVGFDSGTGMPPPRDYRDQPEYFAEGHFPMPQQSELVRALPPNAELILGPIEQNVTAFLSTVTERSPIGFVSVDVDYYWSAKECLRVLTGRPEQYLPMTIVYLDDIGVPNANPWVGELLAVNEFNDEQPMRKIHPYTFLRAQRFFKQTRWIDYIYVMHTLDHPWRSQIGGRSQAQWVLSNPYLDGGS
jgi:hypothetical protein